MQSSEQAPRQMTFRQMQAVAEAAERVKQAALIHDVHELRSRGYSAREAATELGTSKSTVGRAWSVDPQRVLTQFDSRLVEAADAFLEHAAEIPDTAATRRPLPSDVVVFDVMREALTTVRGDFAQMQREALARGDEDQLPQIAHRTVALARRVDAVDPRNREEQLAMTQELRDLHASLEQQLDAP